MHHNESPWVLDHRSATITLTTNGMDEDVYATEDNDEFDSDTEASDDADLNSWCSDTSSLDSCNSNVVVDVPPPMMGNRIVALGGICEHISNNTCCCCCFVDDNLNSFLWYCDREMKAIASSTKHLPKHVADQLRKIIDQVNVRKFYEKWKTDQCNKDDNLTVTKQTYGIATNVTVTCKNNHNSTINAKNRQSCGNQHCSVQI